MNPLWEAAKEYFRATADLVEHLEGRDHGPILQAKLDRCYRAIDRMESVKDADKQPS